MLTWRLLGLACTSILLCGTQTARADATPCPAGQIRGSTGDCVHESIAVNGLKLPRVPREVMFETFVDNLRRLQTKGMADWNAKLQNQARWGTRYTEKQDGQEAPADDAASVPASDANTDPDTVSCSPVNLATGEKLLFETDFAVQGQFGFVLTRTYRSALPGSGSFGARWYSSLDTMRVSTWSSQQVCEPGGACAPKTATVVDASGAT